MSKLKKTLIKFLGVSLVVSAIILSPVAQEEAADPNEPIGGQSVDITEES